MYRLIRFFQRHRIKHLLIFALLSVDYLLLSQQLIRESKATVITSSANELLGALIAAD